MRARRWCAAAVPRPVRIEFRPLLDTAPRNAADTCEGVFTRSTPAVDGQEALQDESTGCYLVGPAVLQADDLVSAEAQLEGFAWTVLVEVDPRQQGPANDVFNACFHGAPTCPGLQESVSRSGQMAIVLDGVVASAPMIMAENLASDALAISGGFDQADAELLAYQLHLQPGG